MKNLFLELNKWRQGKEKKPLDSKSNENEICISKETHLHDNASVITCKKIKNG